MKPVEETEILERLKECEGGADEAALLSDLGALHLSEVRTTHVTDSYDAMWTELINE